MYESVSRSRAERQRQSARGSCQAGVRKISCCYGNGSQRRTRAMCRVGAGGTLSVSLEAASRPLHLHRAVHEEPQEARGQEVQNKQRSEREKKKKSTMQINKVFNDNMSKVILFLTPRRGSNQIAAGGYIGASNRTSFWSKVSYS